MGTFSLASTPTPIHVDVRLGQGDPNYRTKVLARLMAGVDVDRRTGCWLWNRSCGVNGYATVFFKGRLREAVWVAYVLLVAPIRADLRLDHLCHTKACRNRHSCQHLRCVNPNHVGRPKQVHE